MLLASFWETKSTYLAWNGGKSKIQNGEINAQPWAGVKATPVDGCRATGTKSFCVLAETHFLVTAILVFLG